MKLISIKLSLSDTTTLMTVELAQRIADALAAKGVYASGLDGELKATKYHLEDMRKLAGGYSDVQL